MENFALKKGERELPDRLSAAIRECVRDLEICEKHPKYEINMSHWHNNFHIIRDPERKCSVCLGGSRLARIYNDPDFDFNHSMIPAKVKSMDSVRCGNFMDAVGIFYCLTSEELIAKPYCNQLRYLSGHWKTEHIGGYEADPANFKKDLIEVSYKLEKMGL